MFVPVAEFLNGHAASHLEGRTKGKDKEEEEEPKRVMAVRMYGKGEYRAVDEFLHVEEATSIDGNIGTMSGMKGKAKETMRNHGISQAVKENEAQPGPSSRVVMQGHEEEDEVEDDDQWSGTPV